MVAHPTSQLAWKRRLGSAALGAGGGLLLASAVMAVQQNYTAAGVCGTLALILAAVRAGGTQRCKGFSFSLWVLAFVVAALCFPDLFRQWYGFPTERLIVPLIQVIMFGMGTMLSVADFGRVLTMPRAVLVGMLLQFSIMPLLGAGLVTILRFPPEVAAGVVLIGSCPGGVASNVMTFLARGNVALSVTMTACSTCVSPLMTPLLMKLLAGQYIAIEFWPMMVSILNMIIVPILAGLAANYLLRRLQLRGPWLDQLLSLLAMAGICLIIAIITSLSRDQLLHVGIWLVLAAVLHNGCGYALGYAGAWLWGLEEADRRTVAIEVGMQNGGMASGLAVSVLHSSDAALGPAIFGPWMNISGSLLASWWRARLPNPTTSNHEASTDHRHPAAASTQADASEVAGDVVR